jgi:PKD repeat protein
MEWRPLLLLAAAWLTAAIGAGTARATHLLGGEMTYTFAGFTPQGQATYTVRCYIYRDCSSANVNGTGFDLTIPIAVYQGTQLITTVSAPFNAALVEPIVPQDPNSCAELPPDLCIERATYIATVSLAPSVNPYTLSHQRCCRSPAIINLTGPQDTGFTLTTTIPGSALVAQPNSSPAFNVLPQAFICNGLPFALDNSATDPDGDSLAYGLCPIFLGGDPLAPIPNPPLGPAFLPVTWAAGYGPLQPLGAVAGLAVGGDGILTGTPGQLGKFALGVCVEEWRNGVLINRILRDFTLDVVNCNLSAPVYAEVEPCSGLEVGFQLQANPAETYAWDFGVPGEDDVSGEAEPSFVFPAPGVYEVTLLYAAGDCSGSAVFEVVAVEPWVAGFAVGAPACADGGWWVPMGEPTGLPAGASWAWSFSSSAPGEDPVPVGAVDATPETVWFPAGGLAQATLVTSAYGCVETADWETQLPTLPQAAFVVASDPCSGTGLAFDNQSTGAQNFLWSFGHGNASSTAADPTHVFPGLGSYTVVLTAGTETACPDTVSQVVQVFSSSPILVEYAIYPQVLCDSLGGMVFAFQGAGADEVVWDLGAQGVWEGASQVVTYPGPGAYAGMLSLYHAGCDLWIDVPLAFAVPEPLTDVKWLVPNVISPNGDGDNERFAVQFTDGEGEELGVSGTDFHQFQIQVYNRWGNLMFETQDPQRGWWAEGAAEGTYYVVVSGRHVCNDADFLEAGELTVVR